MVLHNQISFLFQSTAYQLLLVCWHPSCVLYPTLMIFHDRKFHVHLPVCLNGSAARIILGREMKLMLAAAVNTFKPVFTLGLHLFYMVYSW